MNFQLKQIQRELEKITAHHNKQQNQINEAIKEITDMSQSLNKKKQHVTSEQKIKIRHRLDAFQLQKQGYSQQKVQIEDRLDAFLLSFIFKYFSIQEIGSLRLINRQFNFIINQHIKKLIMNETFFLDHLQKNIDELKQQQFQLAIDEAQILQLEQKRNSTYERIKSQSFDEITTLLCPDKLIIKIFNNFQNPFKENNTKTENESQNIIEQQNEVWRQSIKMLKNPFQHIDDQKNINDKKLDLHSRSPSKNLDMKILEKTNQQRKMKKSIEFKVNLIKLNFADQL